MAPTVKKRVKFKFFNIFSLQRETKRKFGKFSKSLNVFQNELFFVYSDALYY